MALNCDVNVILKFKIVNLWSGDLQNPDTEIDNSINNAG